MDAIRAAAVHLRLPVQAARLLAIGQEARALELELEAGGCRLTLRDLPPWSLRAILLGEPAL